MVITLIALALVCLIYYLRWRKQNPPSQQGADQKEAIRKSRLLAKKRYDYVFSQIADFENKLLNDIPLSEEEINNMAGNPETRFHFYEMLEAYDKTALFPEDYANETASAESQMVYWLLHEHAFGQRPDEIELVRKVEHEEANESFTYYAFKFRMDAPHKASERGWTLGVSGPFMASNPPYRRANATMSKGEAFAEDRIEPLVSWAHEHLYQALIRLTIS